MNPSREEALFAVVVEKPVDKRPAFLEVLCEGDSALRARLEALLAAHEAEDSLLSEPPVAKNGSATIKLDFADAPDEAVGQTLGRYKLLERVGEGGCGVVYVAEQTEPVRRRVALKVIKLGMDTKQVVARFEAERQALAMMDHPNIAKVLDAGTTELGRPYFVMELVRGIRITEYCDQNNLPTKERLDLFIKVCQAIQHAHQKGIIHRDIKPSNILVTLHDGVPVPKVIDFGIAKATEGRLTDATVYTQLHQFIGTPAYMSPEQAEMSGLDIDTRSDIYSLGVLLYELLVGSTPFDAKELMASGIDAIRKTIREKEPVRPSTRLATLRGGEQTTTAKRRSAEAPKLIHLLKGDLDWIVMKCLEKDRTRRYETANGLAADLKRHLNHEPVVARPPSTAYRFQKAFRRNKLAFIAVSAVAVALLFGIFVSTWQAIRATHAEREQVHLRTAAETARASEAEQRQQAEAARANETRLRKIAQMEAYAAAMKAAQVALAQNSRGQAAELLDRYRPRPGEDDLRGIEWRYPWQQAQGDEAHVWQHPSMVMGARFSPDSRIVVTACYDGFLRVWDVASRKLLTQIDRGVRDDNFIGSFRFSPDGGTLASAYRDGFVLLDTRSWQVTRRLEIPTGAPKSSHGSNPIAFSPDGRRVAVGMTGGIRIWDLADGRSDRLPNIETFNDHGFAFTPDDRALLVSNDGLLQLWDVTSLLRMPLPESMPYDESFVLLKDGSRVAVTRPNGAVKMLDFRTGQTIWSNRWHRASVLTAAFSPDGKTLADGSFDQTIHLLDAATGELRETLRGHLNEVWAVEFSADGRWLVSSGKDGTARLWDLQRIGRSRQWWLPVNRERVLGFGAEGVSIVTQSTNGIVQFWNGTNIVRSLEVVQRGRALLSSDGRRLLIQTGASTIKTYDDTGIEVAQLTVTNRLAAIAAVSGDHRWLAVWPKTEGGEIPAVLDTTSGQVVARFSSYDGRSLGPRPIAFSHDGQLVAYGATNLNVEVWDLKARRTVRSLSGHGWHINSVAFSSDDRLLASSSWEGEARVWDLTTGKLVSGPLRGHGSGVLAVTFSPDSRTLVTAGDDNTVRFWHVATGREMLVLDNANTTSSPLLSPTGEWLLVWDVARQAPRVERIPTLTEIAMAEAGRVSGGQNP